MTWVNWLIFYCLGIILLHKICNGFVIFFRSPQLSHKSDQAFPIAFMACKNINSITPNEAMPLQGNYPAAKDQKQ
jgi:hypothetical protein